MDTLQVMETTLTWVDEAEVPSGRKGKSGRRETGVWAGVMAQLRENPGKWAVISESLDSAKVTGLRYRFPDIEFRGAVVARGKGITTQTKVWACYHGEAEVEEEPTITLMLTPTQAYEVMRTMARK